MAIEYLTGRSGGRGTRLGLRMAAAIVLTLGLALPATSLASSPPSISATPVTAPGTASTITWDTGDSSVPGQVYVKVDGGAESLFGQGASGSASAPWITAGHTYTFSLYAGTSHTPPALTSVDVTATIPAHFISASPNPVTVGHTTDISWSTGSTAPGQIWVSMNGRTENLLTTGPYGSIPIPWILPGFAYIFKLYPGTSHSGLPLDAVTVRSATPAIVVSPLPSTNSLDWSTGDGSPGTVCESVNGGAESMAPGGAGSDGTFTITTGPGAVDVDVFILHAGAGCGGAALASLRLAGYAADYVAAKPNPVVNGTKTTISFNVAENQSSYNQYGQVWVSEDGGPEALFDWGTRGGSEVAPWIYPGHTYVFSLYAGTSHTPPALASVTVTGFNFPTITASPNPVTTGNSSTISWDTGDGSTGEVWVSVNGGAEALVARSSSGTTNPSWIQPGNIYTFTLYQGTAHSVPLASVTVTHS